MTETSFTVALANRTLPFVSRVVRDIVEKHAQWREMESSADQEAYPDFQFDLEKLDGEITAHCQELSSIGCMIKDHATGLVEFPASHGSQKIILCWKLGEDQIGYWHNATEGSTTQRPISELPPEVLGS